MIKFSEKDGAVIFDVRVVPHAAKSEIVGELDGALKIKIAAQPIEGTANAELIKVLSKKLQTAKGKIEIIGGQHSRNKQVKIFNADREVLSKLVLK